MGGRFDWDGGDWEPGHQNAAELFEQRARTAIYSKRGRASLMELREALMALPRHELIEGAMCRKPKVLEDGDIGFEEQEEAAVVAAGQLEMPGAVAAIGPAPLHRPDEYAVCGVGAYVWWQKVKAGMDAVEAFESMPSLDAEDEESEFEGAMFETAWAGQKAGLTFTLAWELASGNDETFEGLTPEKRWEAMVDWIDKVLAEPPLRRGPIPSYMKRLGQSYMA